MVWLSDDATATSDLYEEAETFTGGAVGTGAETQPYRSDWRTLASENPSLLTDRHGGSHLRDGATSAARQLVRQVLLPKAEELSRERQQLVIKEHRGRLDAADETRLRFLDWQLDRIDDAMIGEGLDELDHIATLHRKLDTSIHALGAQLSVALQEAGGRRRRQ